MFEYEENENHFSLGIPFTLLWFELWLFFPATNALSFPSKALFLGERTFWVFVLFKPGFEAFGFGLVVNVW